MSLPLLHNIRDLEISDRVVLAISSTKQCFVVTTLPIIVIMLELGMEDLWTLNIETEVELRPPSHGSLQEPSPLPIGEIAHSRVINLLFSCYASHTTPSNHAST
ncbi:hypothetical protein ACJX0J_016214 [Zea mays]